MQTVMKVMPLFFGFISWTLTAGLGVYFATSSTFRIGQQSLIYWIDGREKGGETEEQDGAEELPEDDEPPRGPSPNASRKKKGRRRK